jgi:uncharacterized protein DUF6599
MRRILLRLAMLALLLPAALAAWAAPDAALLPAEFSGWQKAAGARTGTDPMAADPAYASLLKEFGLTDFEEATYTQADRSIQVKAARFTDATGALGAFFFYRQPRMAEEKIGTMAGSEGPHVLFLQGNMVVDVRLDKVTAMTAASLRELAKALPAPSRRIATLPILPLYLPMQGYVRNSARYVEGPVALAQSESPLPAELVDFGRSAELVSGKYTTSAGTATLTVIQYPTPQIAGDRLRALQAYAAAGSHIPGNTFLARRSGPLVALVTGESTSSEARSLLESVNYDADVTWNEPTFLGPKDNVVNFMINLIYLIAILLLFVLVAGVAFGGLRIVVKRLYPGRFFDRPEDVEIIRLNLR